MTKKIKPSLSFSIGSILLCSILFALPSIGLEAQPPPPVSCQINGTNPVTVGNTYTYTLSGTCSATSWTATCGTIQSSTSTSVTIYFNILNCSSSLIKAIGTTATLTVTVNPAPLTGGSINNPTQTINYNTAPAQITATVPSGGNCGGSYSYQWYSSPNNSSWTAISGATGQNYQPPALTATTYYKRQTICGGSNAYTSNVATITVYPQLVPGNVYYFDNPGFASESIVYDNNSGQMTLSGVSGGSGTYTYQWQNSTDNVHWSVITGATSTSYTSPNLILTTYYNVAVTSNGVTLNSGAFEVIIVPLVSPGTIEPSYIPLASGTSPGEITGTLASGGGCSGSYTYQWQSSTDGINFSIISGATSLNYTPGTLTANTWYRRQVTCSIDIAYTNVCQVVVGGASPNLNFIRARNILKAGVMDTATANGLTNPYDVAQATQYFDGLGRLVQSVAKQASPLQNDIVSAVVYDNFGRQAVQYLPYAAITNDGNYKANALVDQFNFNSTQYPGEQYYYSEVNYEASPANRVLNSYPQGTSWVGSSIGVSAQYLINVVADSVQIWSISSVQLSLPVNGGVYQPGQLLKTIGIDEQGHQMIEFKDKLGRTILKKVQQSASPSTGHAGWLNTYYVYDTLQNIRVIIQPQAVALINGTWTISQNIANELCVRYEYDGRRRMVIKKVPGAGEVCIVYDARNRVVMTQDSALRSLEKWMFTKYDSENRPDSTGFITDPLHYNAPAYHDTLAYYSTNYPTVSSYTNELLTMAFYDDYNWVSTYGAPVASSMATNYTSNSNYFITSYNTYPTYAVAITPFGITRGMPTGSMKKVIGTASQYLYSVNFYDDRGRTIQTQSVNYTGSIDTVTVQYNFNSVTLRSLLNHKKNGNTAQNHSMLTKMDFDHAFRIKHIWKNIDNASVDQLIDSMQYNELGQLNGKYLGNNVDSLVYSYNIRGWLTGINRNYVAGTTNHYFGIELGYDKTTSVAPGNTYLKPEFNGNIEGEVWKSAGSGINRKYDFTYDTANRLRGAAFLQNTSGSSWDKTQVDFSVSNLSYDANGNILTMTQRGFMVGGSSPIDSLSYSYLNSGGSNKLMSVTDAVNNPTSQLEDFHYNSSTKQSTDYNYDGNGNLIQDNNKAISNIAYNYLNLPQLVHMNAEGNITYTYDAAGTRLSKIITDSASRHSTSIIYIGPFVYQQKDTLISPGGGIDTLQFIMHEEGRARWAYHKYTNGSSAYKLEYDFYEKDQLGNIRMVLTQERDTSNYLASMEAAYRVTESQLFANIASTSYAWSSVPGNSGIPSGTKLAITNPNDSVSKVDYNGTSGQTTGPSLLLKVMSGDTLTIGVQSYYNTNSITTTNSSLNSVLNSLAAGLLSTATGNAEGTLSSFTSSSGPVYAAVSTFLPSKDPAPPAGYPKAYLNWILLDDQFNYVSGSSGSVQAASTTYPAATLNTVAPGAPITIPRNGYLYVWVSNETQGWDVFFDNLSIQYKQGPILEENHYYPFGLAMAGLSDKAIKTQYIENKYRYNQGAELQSKEFNDGSGLELYETSFRTLDPQLGRFSQIDPMAERALFSSAYAFAGNNPIFANDPTGLLEQAPEVVQKEEWGMAHTVTWDDVGGAFGAADANDAFMAMAAEMSKRQGTSGSGDNITYYGAAAQQFIAAYQSLLSIANNAETGTPLTTAQTGINVYAPDPTTGKSNLVATIKTTLVSANICLPFSFSVDKPLEFNLDKSMGPAADLAQFVIDVTKPDAIIIDISGGGTVDGVGSIYGTQLVVFTNGFYNDNNVYSISYSTNHENGACIGAGVQVGLGWVNTKNECAENGPSPTNYADGITQFNLYGVGAGAFTSTNSYTYGINSNKIPLWFTFTAGASWDLGTDLRGGICSGIANITSNGPILPCHR
jgi:RHS repeat-associated protein